MNAAGWVALLAGAAVLAAAGPSPRARLRRVASPRGHPKGRRPRPPLTRPPAVVPVLAAGFLAAVALAGVAAGVLAAAGTAAGWRWWSVAAARRGVGQLRASVPVVCRALSAELRAGRPPVQALALAAGDGTALLRWLLAPAVRAAELGGDVPGMLRAAARSPGAARLALLAAAWQVSCDSGASLATLAERLAGALDDEERHRRLVAAQLAGPRASARLLAALPAVGVLLGVALGADPLRLLLHTPWGLACLTTAAALDLLGLLWTERIAAAAVGADA